MIRTAAQIQATRTSGYTDGQWVKSVRTRRHGIYSTYTNGGCRCRPCTDAMRRYRADRTARIRRDGLPPYAVHGTLHTYANLGCRCAPCTEANRLHCRTYQLRRRGAS
jgi:hypothetical protein